MALQTLQHRSFDVIRIAPVNSISNSTPVPQQRFFS